MKKRLILFAITFFILSTILVNAENQAETTQVTSNSSQNPTQVIITIQSKTNTLLSQEPFPEELKGPIRVLFGLEKDEAIPFQNFIIYIALWIMLFLLIQNALGYLPFFGKGAKSWIGALIISCLASITGAIKITAYAFFFIEKDIEFLTTWSIIALIINLAIFAAFFFGIEELLRTLKNKVEIMQAERAGLDTGIKNAI